MEDQEILIPAGSDVVHTITVRDTDGNIFNCSVFTKLVIIVYHASGKIVARFSKNPGPGYNGMDTSDSLNGNLGIKLLTVHTLTSPEGKLFTETHGQYADASLPDDAVLDLLSRDNYLCTITKSITGGVVLP